MLEFFKKMPEVLIRESVSFLPISDLVKFARTNKKHNAIVNGKDSINPLWKERATALGLQESEKHFNLSWKDFLADTIYNSRNLSEYPEALIQSLGGALAFCSYSDLSKQIRYNTVHVPYILTKDMMGKKIARGNLPNGTPFVALAVKDAEDNTSVMILSGRSKLPWRTANFDSFFPKNYDLSLNETSYEYLSRLLKGEPCGSFAGAVFSGSTEGPRYRKDGSSMICLTDQGKKYAKKRKGSIY